MNSKEALEFITKLIDYAKEQINYYENKIVEDEQYPSLQQCHKEELIASQEGLAHLYQIEQDLDQLEKYKSAIKILKDKLNLNVEETFFPPAYNDMSDYGEYDWYLNVFDEFIDLKYYEYALLKEVLNHE